MVCRLLTCFGIFSESPVTSVSLGQEEIHDAGRLSVPLNCCLLRCEPQLLSQRLPVKVDVI